MDDSQGTASPPPTSYWTPPAMSDAPTPSKHPRGMRLLVGAIISYLVASLLYGPGTVIQMVAMITVCTIGIGGLMILIGCWAVGWVALEVWDATESARKARAGA